MSAAAITSPVDAAIERWRESIPEALWEQRIFLLWLKRQKPGRPGKFDKIPIYVNGRQRHGENGSPDDRAQLVDFGDALVAYQRSRVAAGIGMALLADVPVWALDLDDCIFANGQLSALAQRVILAVSYTEHSPSGRGVRALYAGKAGIDAKNHKVGVEIFDSRGFVTLTGACIAGDALLPCPTELLNLLIGMVKASKGNNTESALFPCGLGAKESAGIGVRLPDRVRRRLEAPYASGDDRSAVAYSIALQLARAGITAHEALEIMSVPAVLEPALERRGGDIESARMWMWRYVVLPAYSGTIA